jgi:hypothetical protein
MELLFLACVTVAVFGIAAGILGLIVASIDSAARPLPDRRKPSRSIRHEPRQ